ncbi:MAG: DIP1984 family protein [Nanoarchaeota archaeon]
MKLAQALIERAQLKEQIGELKERLKSNSKVQEGEKPSESPEEILKLIEEKISALENFIKRINKTNAEIKFNNFFTISDAIAKRDMLLKKVNVIKSMVSASEVDSWRVSRSEIKQVPTIDRKKYQKMSDRLSKEYRDLDLKIQELNWQVELLA